MIDFSEANKESLIWHFSSLAEKVLSDRNIEVPFCEIKKTAESYIDNQIAMQKGMQEYYDYLRDVDKKNKRLLTAIKKVKGKTFYKHLLTIIEESEGIDGFAQIVKEPVGKFQKEQYGRTIPGYWVDQWAVGMEGDSWEGTVCVQLKPNKYLKFSYSM